jgi:lipopolysaccharide transport system permease protein
MLAYFVSVWKCRNFWLSLVVNDLQLRYRRSVLGVGWSLLHPLAQTLVMGVVFHFIFKTPIREFLPYLLCGLTCWTYLTDAIIQGCESYIQAENYIRQHPLPLAVYPLRTTLGGMIHCLIGLALVLVLKLGLQGVGKPPEAFSLMLGILASFLFGWAVSILAGFVNIAFRDTKHILEVVFRILFYLSPIIYPKNSEVLTSTPIGWMLAFNPLTPFIEMIRQPLLDGRPASLTCYASGAGIILALALTAAATLGYQQRKVVFYL